jgi:hypothetical protein
VKAAIMLKNAIFNDLFFHQAWKNINKVKINSIKLPTGANTEPNRFRIIVRITPTVKAAGKK